MTDPIPIDAVLAAFDEPILIVEAGRTRAANPAALELLGAEIVDRDVRLALRHPQALAAVLEGRRADLAIVGLGSIDRPWTLSIKPLKGSAALLVRLIDRSPMIAAERMRVDFVANASHELRTPLTTVMGYAETLADDGAVPDEIRASFAGSILTEARRMLGIIEDLMSLSRIEANRFDAPRTLVDIEALAREAIAQIAPLAERKQCQVRLAIADGPLPPVRGDRAQLLQSLDNLLSNAIRYGCGGETHEVELILKGSDREVRITVSDKGPGIDREHLPRLTERFYRVDPARSRGSGGTGLGLSIVKHVVERHRGALDIRSAIGAGTKVTISLPAAGNRA